MKQTLFNAGKSLFWKAAPLLPDALRLRILFRRTHGVWPDLHNPRTFSEKIQWRKLHDRRETLTLFADKYRVRDYVAARIGEQHLAKTYWASESAQTLPFEELPQKFVLKANHGTRWNILVPDKSAADRAQLVSTLDEWLDGRYPPEQGEWGYLNVRPLAFAEEFLSTRAGEIPVDFKFFVFNGSVRMIQVDLERFIAHSRCLYDPDWNLFPAVMGYPRGKGYPRPENLAAMIRCAQQLAAGIDFVRVDLYNVDGRIVFGELTNYPGGGLEEFTPAAFDATVGEWWKLDDVAGLQAGGAPGT
jgi:hypothetical protein